MGIKELLPIGSIVLLNNGKKRLMITGIKQTDFDNNREYDYLGVLYPEGHMGVDSQFLFNHSDIEEVFFYGYKDEERREFLAALSKFYKENEGK